MKSDQNWVAGLTGGQLQTFRDLYDLFSDKVYNTALSYTQNTVDAEEVTQEVFIRIFQKASQFKGDSTLSTWIYRISVNTSLNFLRKKRRFLFFKTGEAEIDQPDFQHPGVLLENKEEATYLFKTIATLPESQKTAFILSYIEHLPRQEVADIMDLSLKAVESLLQRGKNNLRKKLEKFYPDRRKE
ncbi:MAG: RNA polymerase sigma factor [Saprospiraceae bacterium]|nr:RNA polymerase sigma factor [Saprospiraceae bacterium]